ncbi:Thioredoxin-like protein, chloroplastic [Quillaja saponaria]|uniref:Thioredoxin-like protein, chloroplastic n=1 Tax=Quillaja saponaria TaxID=32244 RepID=A0AAD7P734_QUISA|nr:Thioredoxin-like protein, chloroplastic [Quillaja saponaria]
MVRVASTHVGLHRFRPYLQIPQPAQLVRTPFLSLNKTRKFKSVVACQTDPNPTETSKTERLIVEPETLSGLFLSTRLDFGVSLKDLSAAALPYEEALSNGKPTVVEFYADWCEVCRELAPDVHKVEQQYKDRVNLVMLNVDNTKWEQELDEFGVEGIPSLYIP